MVSRIRCRSVGVVIRCLAREAAEDDGELIPPRPARYDRGHTRSPATAPAGIAVISGSTIALI
jgi:hypothetical protein